MAARFRRQLGRGFDELHIKKADAEFVLKRCGKLAANLPEAV